MIASREGSLCLQSHFPYFVCSEQLPFLPAATPKLSLSPLHSRCLNNATLSFSPFLVVNSSERCLAALHLQEKNTSWLHRVSHFTDLAFPSSLHLWSGLSVPSLPSRGHCNILWKSLLHNHHTECPPLSIYCWPWGNKFFSKVHKRTIYPRKNQHGSKTTKKHHTELGQSPTPNPYSIDRDIQSLSSQGKIQYLDCSGRDLDLVESPHGAITVYKVGGSKLVQRFNALGSISRLSVEAAFVHVHGQGLLSCSRKDRFQ